jgi:hypothetical protein
MDKLKRKATENPLVPLGRWREIQLQRHSRSAVDLIAFLVIFRRFGDGFFPRRGIQELQEGAGAICL